VMKKEKGGGRCGVDGSEEEGRIHAMS